MRERTYGLLIRKVDYGETSLIVSFLTPDFGRVQAMAKGAKRKKNSFQSALDLMVLGEMLFIPKKRGLSILTEFYLEDSFARVRQSLPAYYSACYILEILRYISYEGIDSLHCFQSAIGVLTALDYGANPSLSLCFFDIHILDFLGVFPNIKDCVFCEGQNFNTSQIGFSFREGGIVCSRCRSRARDVTNFSRPLFKIIKSLKGRELPSVQTISIPEKILKEIEVFLHRNVAYAIDRKPRILKFLGLSI